jgi:hypothetical protein
VSDKLNYLPFQILDRDHISSCTSAGSVLPPQLRHFYIQLLMTFSVLKWISMKSASYLFFGDFGTGNSTVLTHGHAGELRGVPMLIYVCCVQHSF